MDFAEYKDILVVLELDEGKPVNVSLENIAAAKSVVNGGKVIAVTVCENAAKTAIEYGADSAIVMKALSLKVTSRCSCRCCSCRSLQKLKPCCYLYRRYRQR